MFKKGSTMVETVLLNDLTRLFAMGVAAVVLFHRLNLPPVLGFLVTGVIAGPFGFKLVDGGRPIEALAEIGLVLLLFEAGIEFSVSHFMRLKKFLLLAGSLQILLTIAATVGVGHLFDISWQTSAFIGMLIALSSTAIVLRILEYRGEIETTHGRASFSILIFQDLCLVPLVLATPFLAGKGGSLTEVGTLVGKALLFLVAAGAAAKLIVPWVLNQVAKTKKREAFVLSVLLLCLGTASATAHFGLSMALGAFIAGLIISESKFNHQALGEILPFREVFNCLVFVAIGMMFDVRVLLAEPMLIVGALAIVLAIKFVVGAGVTKLAGHSLRVAILTGVTIAQVSEFSFVLAKLGLDVGLIDNRINQLFLAVAIMSMFVTPAFITAGHGLIALTDKLIPMVLRRGKDESDTSMHEATEGHTILVGFGVGGRNVAQALSEAGIPYVAIEHDPEVVRDEKTKKTPIHYGDATRREVLNHACIAHARVVALTISDAETAKRSIALVRQLNPNVHIVARSAEAVDVQELLDAGANQVVNEEMVSSREILSNILDTYRPPAQ